MSREVSGRITVVGGGELMPSMSRLHREVLASLGAPPRAVFLDATAGFETNVDAIVAKAVEYYRRYLQTELRVARYRHRESASQAEVAAAIAEVRSANLIFAGPGSPTYALRQWRDSPVWDALVEQVKAGSHLLFASAAAVTLGCYALPVYEIYKVGADPFWTEGLDLFGRIGLKLAIVPHFNDSSGGESHDTRFCYMGAARFRFLREMLPSDTVVLGIDHYTAISFDPLSRTARVSGQGHVTVISGEEDHVYGGGSSLSFEAFGPERRPVAAPAPAPEVGARADRGETPPSDPLESVIAYVETMDSPDEGERLELLTRLQGLRRQLQPAGSGAPDAEGRLVDLILGLRTALREQGRYDLADRAREALVALGYEVADTPRGATWSRRAG